MIQKVERLEKLPGIRQFADGLDLVARGCDMYERSSQRFRPFPGQSGKKAKAT